MSAAPPVIVPDWPLPPGVRALSTTRAGGVSTGPYASLNLGDHVGDDPAAVAENRRRLELLLPAAPLWLTQVHGCDVAPEGASDGTRADAAVARTPGRVCAVMTADCLPVLLADREGRAVAAAHAGWRGLAGGVLESAVDALGLPGGRVTAWLGPAIGPNRFEVGEEVRAAFLAADPGAAGAFAAGRPGHWMADLYQLARRRLAARGVTEVHGGGHCTHAEAGRFFSFRRDGATGRMATLIWIEG